MLEKISRFLGFGNLSAGFSPPPKLNRDGRGDDGTIPRSWDAAIDTEENAHQWVCADGRTINEILVDHYETISQRCRLEAQRNPTVEGVIKSHAADVVGDNGPGLQVLSDDDAWNDDAESIWSEFCESVDGSGKLSLGEWLRQDVAQTWTAGDMICQVVEDRDAPSVIKTRVHPILPLRMKSPYVPTVNQDIMLGVERNRYGRPIRYYFEDEVRSEYGYRSYEIRPIPARDIMHWFEELEPGQVRGWPRLASCLQAISDLREYDNAVLDAAKVQAMMCVLMEMQPELAEMAGAIAETPAAVKLKRMGITTIPRGWTANALNSTQPNAQNTDFRNERTRELGRPAGMPLMQIRLDSSGHNYSSARFDAQTYQKINRVFQGSLGRHRVCPLVKLVLNESMRRGILRPRVIRTNEISFRWPQPPHVDPVKEAMAERIRLENRTLSPLSAADSHNLDFEKLAREWKRANEILEKNGMPPLFGAIPTNLTELLGYLMGEESNGSQQDSTQAA